MYDLPVCSLEPKVFITWKQRTLESKVSNGVLKEWEHARKRQYGREQLITDLWQGPLYVQCSLPTQCPPSYFS